MLKFGILAAGVLVVGIAQSSRLGELRYSAMPIVSNYRANSINDSYDIVGTMAGRAQGRTMLLPDTPFWLHNGAGVGLAQQFQSGGVMNALNNRGQAVGHWLPSANGQRAFLFVNGHPTDLGNLGGNVADALALNNTGNVVGYSFVDSANWHAFDYFRGAMHDLGTLGGRRSQARSVNNAGEVVGLSETSTLDTHGFLFSNGRLTDIGTLGGKMSEANGINSDGYAVGSSTLKDGTEHAFVLANGKLTDLVGKDGLGSKGSRAYAINDSGQIAGQVMVDVNGTLEQHAALFENGKVYDLNDMLLYRIMVKGYLTEAVSINRDGLMVVHDDKGASYYMKPTE